MTEHSCRIVYLGENDVRISLTGYTKEDIIDTDIGIEILLTNVNPEITTE